MASTTVCARQAAQSTRVRAQQGASARRASITAAPRRSAPQQARLAPRKGSSMACRAVAADPADLLKDAVRLDEDGNEALRFLTPEEALEVRAQFGTPAYVYDMATLKEQASKALEFPNPFGLTARFAMKASPNIAILKLFCSMGLHIDASSGYEVRRAMGAGYKPEQISLSTQELPTFFPELLSQVQSHPPLAKA